MAYYEMLASSYNLWVFADMYNPNQYVGESLLGEFQNR